MPPVYLPPHRRTVSLSSAPKPVSKPPETPRNWAFWPKRVAPGSIWQPAPQAPVSPANTPPAASMARVSVDSDPGAEALDEVAWAQMHDIASHGQRGSDFASLREFAEDRFFQVACRQSSASAAAQWQLHMAEMLHTLYARAHADARGCGESPIFAVADALAVMQARGQFLIAARQAPGGDASATKTW